MDLFEYQARDLFAAHDVPVLPGEVAATVEEARAAAERIGGRVVVKAQVQTGGRGKAGGVQLAEDPDSAASHAHNILGMEINGHTVHRVMVAKAGEIENEYYVSFLLDRANRCYLAMVSVEGGVEIEHLAVERPEAIVRARIDALAGCDLEQATQIVEQAGFPAELVDQVAQVLVALWEVLIEEDATLVEVNPLVLTPQGQILALDGKITLDDNARYRHPDHAELDVPKHGDDPLEQRARDLHLNYVKLDGQVGIIGNGAGLVMSTLDVVAGAGEEFGGIRPANFLDIGGGASAQVMANGLEIILADPSVRSILVNVFGGITSCDAVAHGIVQAVELLAARGEPITKPLVCRLDGNNAAEGRRILDEAEHDLIELVDTMDDAARRVAELAASAK